VSEGLAGAELTLVSGHSPQQLHQIVAAGGFGTVLGSVELNFTGRLRKGQPSGLNVVPSSPSLNRVDVPSAWHRVRHGSVGGATEFVALFYVLGIALDPQVTSLRRTI
jgi:hypothetical protein